MGARTHTGTGLAAVAAAALTFAIAGCGGGGDSASAPQHFPAPTIPADAPQPPKGASPVLHEIYRQFTPPKPDPRVKGSAKAIAAGKRACDGKTPLEVKDAYYPIAIESGNLDASSDQAKMIADIDKYAKNVTKDASFAAGQLAADAYQATLPAKIASYGYQGCVYVMARRLEKQLAPKK